MAAVKTGVLRVGFKVGDEYIKEFEMREAKAGDIFDAELIADPQHTIQFRAALICRTITRIGRDISGPIDMQLVRELKPDDFDRLYEKHQELEKLGKSAPQPSGTTT